MLTTGTAKHTSQRDRARDRDIENDMASEDGRRALEFYSDVIKEYLVPSQVLPYLISLLTENQVQQILAKHDQREACDCLISVLIHCSQPGWYRCFLQALRLAEFDLLADVIEGHADIKNQQVFRNLLKVFYPNFSSDLNPWDIIPHLLQFKCITDADVDHIKAVYETRGRLVATMVLLPMVAMKQRGWFPRFMHALKDAGYDHLVKDVAPEFMSQEDLDGATFVATKIEQSVSTEEGGGFDGRYVPFERLMRMHSMPDLLGSDLNDDRQGTYSYVDCCTLRRTPQAPPTGHETSVIDLFGKPEADPMGFFTPSNDLEEGFDDVDSPPGAPSIESSQNAVNLLDEVPSDPPSQATSTEGMRHIQSYPLAMSNISSGDSAHDTTRSDYLYYNTIGSYSRNPRVASRSQTSISGNWSTDDIVQTSQLGSVVLPKAHLHHRWQPHIGYYNVADWLKPGEQQQVTDHDPKWVPRPPHPSPRRRHLRNRVQVTFAQQTCGSEVDALGEAPVAPPRRRRRNKSPPGESRTVSAPELPQRRQQPPAVSREARKQFKYRERNPGEEHFHGAEEQSGNRMNRRQAPKSEEEKYAESLKHLMDESATAEERNIIEMFHI